jgi:hypothetical protein
VSAERERLPLTERVFGSFTAVSHWAGSDLASRPDGREPRGCGHPLGVLKALVFLLVIVAFPVFVLPMVLARLAQTGWTGIRYGASADMASGEAARWGHGALPLVPAAGPDGEPVAEAALSIAVHDPRFQADALAGWAVMVTARLRQSLMTGEPAPARTFMANGLYRTHQALLELRTDAGVSYTGQWRAVDAAVIGTTRSALVEQVWVRVSCQGWRWERHEPTGVTLRGGPEDVSWSEDLTFARAAGAVTPPSGGVLASRCPSCGAGLDLDPGGACRYCRGVVTAGRHDWVLVSWRSEPW